MARAVGRAPVAHAALTGALLGLSTAALVGLVDFVSASSGAVTGSRAELALSLASLLVVTLAPAGALAGLWLLAIARHAESRGQPIARRRKWLYSSVAGLPLLAGVWWVPWSWLAENAATLTGQDKLVAAGVYLGLLGLVVCASRVAWWCHDVYQQAPARLPLTHWPLCTFSLLSAAGCYWADRTLLVELYEDFHYGLAGAFVLSLALFVILARETLRRFQPGLVARWQAPSRPVLVRLAAIVLCSAAFQLSGANGARATNALVCSKAALTLLHHSDFDGDGHSSLLGGLDCAPFDGRRGPRQADLPGNGVDEDCTGSEASWPKPQSLGAYPIPDARGFNLLLISVDALRADRTSVFGHARKTTPNLERLAQQGLAFSRAYSQGTKTFESMPSMFTGLYVANVPRDYGHRRVRGRKPYMYTMTDEGVTVTQLLAERGYQTRAIVPIKALQDLGLDRGFQKFEESSKSISRKAQKYLRGAKEPFFLWLHYFDPHEPYTKHPRYDFGSSDLDRYDGEIANADAQIGEVLKELEASGLGDKTIVVLTADHGEEFREHGGQFHSNKLHEELLHVPLLIKVPGVAPARVDDLVEVLDIAPTLCEALALRPGCADFDGQSLWATRAGKRQQTPGFRGAYSEALMQAGTLKRRSLLSEGFRLTVNLDEETVELFDVVQDPGEQHNLAQLRPDLAKRLREEMALRPHRRSAAPFEAALQSDSSELVATLPLIRSEPLLLLAIETIAQHPSPGSQSSLKLLESRPGLGNEVRAKLGEMSGHRQP